MIGAGLAAALAGCGRARGDGRLSLWAMDAEGENSPALLPAFRRATGIAVDLQWLAWTAAHEKLLTAFAGGSLPDVFMLSNAWAHEFAMIGATAPLPERQAALTRDQFAPVLDSVRFQGRVHSLPWVIDTAVQFYRHDLLAAAGYDAPPPDRDGWRAMLRAVKRRRGDGYAILMQLNWPDHLVALAAQGGAPFLRDQDSRGHFASDAFREALGFYKSLFDERLAAPVLSAQAPDPTAELARGWVAIYPAGSWTRADLLRRTAELPRERWAVAAMPGPSRRVVAGSSLAVAANARDPDAAWALVRYLCSPPTQVALHRVAGDLPSRPSSWRAPVIADDPLLRLFGSQAAEATALPTIPEWPRIAEEMQSVAELMVRGQLGVDAAAQEIDRRADRLLVKRRSLLDQGRAL